MLFEDYARGGARHALIAATTILSHVITATGLFALARIAL
jgi:succinate dehydrogenase / fumarate reductase membrane anchor subunit